jgi:hypothetical protein
LYFLEAGTNGRDTSRRDTSGRDTGRIPAGGIPAGGISAGGIPVGGISTKGKVCLITEKNPKIQSPKKCIKFLQGIPHFEILKNVSILFRGGVPMGRVSARRIPAGRTLQGRIPVVPAGRISVEGRNKPVFELLTNPKP